MTMVVEGSRRSKLAGHVHQDVQLSSGRRPKTSADDAFTLDCLATLGLKTAANGNVNGTGKHDADTDNMTIETEKQSTTKRSPLGRSEKECLTLIALARMMRDRLPMKSYIAPFLMHSIMTSCIPVPKRGLDLGSDGDLDPSSASFIQAFASHAGDILASSAWERTLSVEPSSDNIIDLVDGRLLQFVTKHQGDIYKAVAANASHASRLSEHIALVEALSGIELDVAKDTTTSVGKIELRTAENTNFAELAVLPFANEIFDQHLVSIKISIAKGRTPKPESARIFQEVTHWHDVKRRLDPKAAETVTAKQKFWALKRNQWFMAEMLSYAASLTNASGGVLEPETVTVSDIKKVGKKALDPEKENKPIAKPSQPQVGKGTSKGKVVGNKTVRESINATRAAKEEDSVEKAFRAWATARKFIDSDVLPRSRYTRAKTYLNNLKENKQKHIKAEVEFYKLCTLLEIYQKCADTEQSRKSSEKDDTLGLSAMLWDSIKRLASINTLTQTIVDNAQQIVTALGLPKVDFPAPGSTRQLSFAPTLRLAGLPQIALASEPRNFQLLHCGPYMDRNLDSAPDPRVPFEPDGWQRKVLDELDANNSVFVVAPTSAGKTFISFYAMERVLRSSDEGVLVYVAPTKALVNQIAAEIQVNDTLVSSFYV